MKIRFKVEYDSETGSYSIDSRNTKIIPSGSGYLRIKFDDKQIGTIGSYQIDEIEKRVMEQAKDYKFLTFAIHQVYLEKLLMTELLV